jgi:hypothetical protein
VSEVASTQPTQPAPVLSATEHRFRAKIANVDWDKTLTDAMIYLLAIGGFYVGYQTLYRMALTVGFPDDQATVVAALADLAILAYSRKAVQEVNAGRSAWTIRTIVAAFSLGTFALQLRAAWPHPTAVAFHALPPAVWIIGHEMMLRGKLRHAKSARRASEIAAGLRPAPLPAIRRIHWILSFRSTFKVWRRVKLWEVPQAVVVRKLADDLKSEGKPVPAAWQGILLATPTPPLGRIVIPDLFKDQRRTPEKPTAAADRVKSALHRASTGEEVTPDVRADFLKALPKAPVEGRPKDAAIDYIKQVEKLADTLDIRCTGLLLAELLDVQGSYVSRLRKEITAVTTP